MSRAPGLRRALAGRLTPSEAMEATLQRIRESEAMSPPMAFFISLDEADVRAQAAASTERWAASRSGRLSDPSLPWTPPSHAGHPHPRPPALRPWRYQQPPDTQYSVNIPASGFPPTNGIHSGVSLATVKP